MLIKSTIRNIRKIPAFSLLFFVFLLSFCSEPKDAEDERFNCLYSDFIKYNYADFDTLVKFYHQVDSIHTTYPSVLLDYLRKSVEGRLNYRSGDYLKSNIDYKDAINSIAGRANVDTLFAASYMGIGINYMATGAFDSAVYYFKKSEMIYDSLKCTSKLSIIYANFARTYYNKGEPAKALEFIEKTLSNAANKSVLLGMLHLKANILGSSGKIDSALILDKQMVDAYKNTEYGSLISPFYNNMGLCYLAKMQTDSAIFYCKKSYEADSLFGMKMNMAANLILLGDVYYQQGEIKKGKEYFDRALSVFSKNGNADKKYAVFQKLAGYAEKEGDLLKLSQYKDSMLLIYKTINSTEVNQTIERLNIEHESVKKNQQIVAQKKQLRTQKVIILLTSILAFLILATFYFLIKYRTKINKLRLAEQDKKLLTLIVEAEQTERSRIARDLHDGVSQKLAVLQMYTSIIESVDEENVQKVSGLLKETASEVRTVSHNLYPKDIEKGLKQALETLCLQNNMLPHGIRFSFKTKNEGHVNSERIDYILFRIVQEVTNNAIKYSKAQDVEIQLNYLPGKIQLILTDNGVGFDLSTIEESKGIGLRSITDRVKQMNGIIQIASEIGKGAKYTIEIAL